MKLQKSLVGIATLVVLLVGFTSACGSDDNSSDAASFSVTEAVVPVAAGANTAVYFNLTNSGTKADSLVKAETSVAQNVEIHRSFQDPSGMMKMEEQDAVKVDPGQTVMFEPGSYHVMLLDVDDLTEGDTVKIDLMFAESETLTIEATVVSYSDVAH